ncbi:MAG: PadR family transcriptional regulator [Candidatus Saccharibacteria bacterium]|nr:PadR family transcriptional regulator [Candidatus Saccharibacteria bacterium]
MSANYTLLGFLASEPNYGYELKKKYDSLFGKDKPILSGQIYSTLSRLKRDGKVEEVKDTDESGGPERVKYQITPRGQEAFEAWLAMPEAPSQYLQTTMYMKTVLALMRDGDAAPYLDAQRHTHIERMRQLTRQRRDSDLATTLLIDHALYHIEADLRWIDMTSSRLTKLKEELCL